MGFERNRFVDQNIDEELICSICLNVFETAVTTDCVHTFCLECVKQMVTTNKKTCPECRTNFTPKRRREDNNSIIVGNYVFRPNRTANNMISKLKIKCDYESFGCKKSIELSSLQTHLNECPFKRCKTCEMYFDSNDGHNCLEVIKRDRNDWKTKFNELKQNYGKSLNSLRQQNSNLISNLSLLSLPMNSVTIENQRTFAGYLKFNSNQHFLISYFNRNAGPPYVNLSIDYKSINELMYCSHSSNPLMIIKLVFQSYKQILEDLTSKYGFNIKSIGISIVLNSK